MNYNKKTTTKKRNSLTSNQLRQRSRISLFVYKYIIIALIAILAILAGLSVGFLKGVLKNIPEISMESISSQNRITTIYDNSGKEITTVSSNDSNHIYTKLENIPIDVQNAFIAIEDQTFYNHNGVDYTSYFSTILNSTAKNETISLQIVKNNILGIETETTAIEKLERKIKEQALALKLEKIASKQTILEEYLNVVNLGNNTLGVQAAAKKYFNKDVNKLTLSESSVLASMVKNPTKYNPAVHPESNASRRLLVLQNMLDLHYITKKEYKEALNDDVYTRIKKIYRGNKHDTLSRDYFQNALILQVVADLKSKLGYDETKAYNAIYNGGLKIYATQDTTIQKIADEVALDEENYPEDSKYSITYSLSIESSKNHEKTYSEQDVLTYMKKHKLGDKLIFDSKSQAKEVVASFKRSVHKKKTSITGENLSITIQPQVSMTVINQSTGNVEALIGGRDTNDNQSINRATSISKQPGSSFSIVSTFLPLLEASHKTLATVYDDAPYRYLDTNQEVSNTSKDYQGYTTVRDAITSNINTVTAKAMADVTPSVSYEYLTSLGITTLVDSSSNTDGHVHTDIKQSLSSGQLTNGVTNLQLTNAYATIANAGNYYKPKFYTTVVDEHGKVLLNNNQKATNVASADTCFLLTDTMEDVLDSSFGQKAKLDSMHAAGQAGTTADNSDHWFVGYTPYHTIGVWMGYDRSTSFDSNQLEQTIWNKTMEQITQAKNEKDSTFQKPDSIEKVRICKKSGKLAVDGVCDHDPRGSMITTEYFQAGTEPTATCDTHVSMDICTDSNLPATKNCPQSSIEKRIYMIKPKHSIGTTADTPYELPALFATQTCNQH